MIMRCHVCNADPRGRWKQPPACIFIDHDDGGGRYACRDHLSGRREAEIKARERDLGLPVGGLR